MGYCRCCKIKENGAPPVDAEATEWECSSEAGSYEGKIDSIW
jgi:hypothetical protein